MRARRIENLPDLGLRVRCQQLIGDRADHAMTLIVPGRRDGRGEQQQQRHEHEPWPHHRVPPFCLKSFAMTPVWPRHVTGITWLGLQISPQRTATIRRYRGCIARNGRWDGDVKMPVKSIEEGL